jgi:hypothetical protein
MASIAGWSKEDLHPLYDTYTTKQQDGKKDVEGSLAQERGREKETEREGGRDSVRRLPKS